MKSHFHQLGIQKLITLTAPSIYGVDALGTAERDDEIDRVLEDMKKKLEKERFPEANLARALKALEQMWKGEYHYSSLERMRFSPPCKTGQSSLPATPKYTVRLYGPSSLDVRRTIKLVLLLNSSTPVRNLRKL